MEKERAEEQSILQNTVLCIESNPTFYRLQSNLSNQIVVLVSVFHTITKSHHTKTVETHPSSTCDHRPYQMEVTPA